MKQSDEEDSGTKADIEFGGDSDSVPGDRVYFGACGPVSGGEYVEDPVGHEPAYPMEDVITAMEMAQITIQGEHEFRSKIGVEISHNIKDELAHVIKLCRSAGVQGSHWVSYDNTQWTDWIKKGPELSAGTTDTLARRKTKIREHMILEALKIRLEWEGYTCDITRPYRGMQDDKEFLYIQWNRPKPSLSKGSCWRTIKTIVRLLLILSVVLGFFASFAALLGFTVWLLVTRWEKLELWE
jgi:hypothetical protein